jgi:hypothetical protein
MSEKAKQMNKVSEYADLLHEYIAGSKHGFKLMLE